MPDFNSPRSVPKSRLLWLFDLDNTLHDAGRHIFPAIEENMNAFISSRLEQDAASVSALRQLYWQRYGATVLGLIKHHAMTAEEFLHPVHALPNLVELMRYERGLARLLRRLPGRKILLTNAPAEYSHRVLRQLGLQRHFDRHIPIEAMHVHRQLRPKPDKLMLRRLLARERHSAKNTVLIEDSALNLKSAKSLGIATVWITQYLNKSHKKPIWVDLKTPSVHGLLKRRPARNTGGR